MAEEQAETVESLISALPSLSNPAKAGALKAISQLLGGTAAYLSAWMRSPTQAIENRTNAKQVVHDAVALAAAKMAADDPEIVEKALNAWLPKELRRAENKQKVTQYTLEDLSEKDRPEADQAPGQIDEDWLNSFERFCEDASSEKLQRLWGRVLAGEIVSPGTFGKRTLRFIYDLDQETADAFEAISQHVINGQVFLKESEDAINFSKLLALDSSGVVSGAGGMITYNINVREGSTFTIAGENFGLACKASDPGKISLEATPLSPIGRELMKINPNNDEKKTLLFISSLLEKNDGFMSTCKTIGCSLCKVVFHGTERRLQKQEHLWGEKVFP